MLANSVVAGAGTGAFLFGLHGERGRPGRGSEGAHSRCSGTLEALSCLFTLVAQGRGAEGRRALTPECTGHHPRMQGATP